MLLIQTDKRMKAIRLLITPKIVSRISLIIIGGIQVIIYKIYKQICLHLLYEPAI